MKKRLLLTLAWLGICLHPGCRSLKFIDSSRLTTPPEADGRMVDLTKQIVCHLYDNGMMVGVGNDEENLYVFFSPDIRARRRMPSRAELTLWLDESGKKSKKLAYVYAANEFPPDMKKPDLPPDGGEGGQAATPPAMLKIVDRVHHREMLIPVDGSGGAQISVSKEWGDFTYQWRIPLKRAKNRQMPAGEIKPGQTISLGLFWEMKPLFDPKERKKKGDFPSGMGDDEMGGMPPGPGSMGGPGRGPGPGFPGGSLNETKKIWLQTKIKTP